MGRVVNGAAGPVIVAGEFMLDVLSLDASAEGPGFFVRPGGSAATVALHLAATGREVIVAGRAGTDPNGRWLLRRLAEAGVTAPVEPARHAATGFVIIHRRAALDRVAYVERGANRLLENPAVADRLPVETSSWLHVSGYCLLEPGPAEVVRLLAARARQAGVPISVDPGNPEAFGGLARRLGLGPRELGRLFGLGLEGGPGRSGPDYLLPSAGMACYLTGAPGAGEASVALAGGPDGARPVAVVKDGPAGAWIEGRNIPVRVEASRAGRPRTGPTPGGKSTASRADVNGAGDVFDAAFIAASLGGLPPEGAAAKANAAAAAFVAENLALGAHSGRGAASNRVAAPGWTKVACQEPPVLISACLFDTVSAYDALPKPRAAQLAWNGQPDPLPPDESLYLPVCPEQFGGLSTPRPAAEIQGQGGGQGVIRGTAVVVDREGGDLTEPFLKGARRVVELARATGARRAILKEGSPSCGVRAIHDGAFSKRRIPGQGVVAATLAELGVEVEPGADVEPAAEVEPGAEG